MEQSSHACQLKIHETHEYELKILKTHAYELKILTTHAYETHAYELVEDPVDDDRIPVEVGAEPESEKLIHDLTFKPWCTSCVKGKAHAGPHKRIERITEDSELPIVQCDYLVLKKHCSFRRTESF